MKILIAPDKMKYSLPAPEVAEYIRKGIVKVFPDAEFIITPLADGGEGTARALTTATGGHLVAVPVHDALQREIKAYYGITSDGETAIIEIAAASGIEHLKPEERNPLLTTSYGSGELIKAALDSGCKKFIIGLGGSATNDGGAGLTQALGAKLLDAAGKEISYGGGSLDNLHTIDITGMDVRLKNCSYTVACDVKNPLTGNNGASYVFGPQKGATAEMIVQLDSNLKHYAKVIKKSLGKDVEELPGAGAAGGLGAGLKAFLNAELTPGFEIVAELTGLEEQIKKADIVVTAEGKTDSSTLSGKVPYGVAQLAKKHQKPVLLFTGTIGNGSDKLYDAGITSIIPIVNKPMALEEAIPNTPQLLSEAAERTFLIIKAFL